MLGFLKKEDGIEEDDKILLNLKSNLRNYNLNNIEIVKSMLEKGYSSFSPYDLIIIDCPLYNFKQELVKQLNSNQGRLIYIEKVNDDLSKAYKLIRNNFYTNIYMADILPNSFDGIQNIKLLQHYKSILNDQIKRENNKLKVFNKRIIEISNLIEITDKQIDKIIKKNRFGK